MIFFTLYSRSYCHLCDDMKIALEKLVEHIPHEIQILDVDQNPKLLILYDELVPVLSCRKLAGNDRPNIEQQLCHYFLDEDKVKEFCNE